MGLSKFVHPVAKLDRFLPCNWPCRNSIAYEDKIFKGENMRIAYYDIQLEVVKIKCELVIL